MGACASAPMPEEQGAPTVRRPAPARNTTTTYRASRGSGVDRDGGDAIVRSGASFAASIVGWEKDFPAMTRLALDRKREEFWDTRVQGRAECWQALRAAIEAGEGDAESPTTQAILESAEMTPFDCDKPGECFSYDAKGFRYDVPLYCLFLPSNLITQPEVPVPVAVPLQVQPAKAAPSPIAVVEPIAPPADGKLIKFKVRFSNNRPDLLLDQSTSLTLGQLKALILSRYTDLPRASDRLRIFYLGKHLAQDRWRLEDIGLRKDMVLQCFVLAAGKA